MKYRNKNDHTSPVYLGVKKHQELFLRSKFSESCLIKINFHTSKNSQSKCIVIQKNRPSKSLKLYFGFRLVKNKRRMPLKIAKESCIFKKLKEKLGNHTLNIGRQKARESLLVMRKKEVTTQLFFERRGGAKPFSGFDA